jgi:hypothetical protein
LMVYPFYSLLTTCPHTFFSLDYSDDSADESVVAVPRTRRGRLAINGTFG